MSIFIGIGMMALGLIAFMIYAPIFQYTVLSVRTKVLGVGVCVSLLIGLVLVLYGQSSNYVWDAKQRATANGQLPPEVQALVDRLEAKLTAHPEDMTGWMLLARSRMAMRQFALAERAYRQADHLASHRNADALVGLSVAILVQLNDTAPFPAAASEALEAALKLNPELPDALYYGGIAAREHGSLALARERWLKLLAQHPADDIRQAVIDNIRSVDLAQGLATDPQLEAILKTLANTNTATSNDPLLRVTPQPYVITVKIVVDPKIKAALPSTGFVFLSAKPDQSAGPPWLARKIPLAALPLTVQLTEQDALMGTHSLKALKDILVTAKVSISGDAITHSGDWVGQIRYPLTHAKGAVTLTIQQQVP
jgi:cytochrome c-type biogenesis protein CcmH